MDSGTGVMTLVHKLGLVALGGALGALARFGLAGTVARIAGTRYPWGTTAVNLSGCFLFGLLWAMIEHRLPAPHGARMILLTGFLGAYTTFSTFAFENAALLRDGQWGVAVANLAVQNVLGLALVLAGLAMGRAP